MFACGNFGQVIIGGGPQAHPAKQAQPQQKASLPSSFQYLQVCSQSVQRGPADSRTYLDGLSAFGRA